MDGQTAIIRPAPQQRAHHRSTAPAVPPRHEEPEEWQDVGFLGHTDLWLTAEESRTPTCDQTNYGKPPAEQEGGAQPHPRRDSIAETGGASASI
jgi:hypothetical protein